MIIRLAIECHSCIQSLMPAIEKFQKKNPTIEIDFYSDITFSPQQFLQKGDLDIVLTSEVLPRNNLFYEPIFDFEVRLVLSPKHPLVFKNNRIIPEDLVYEKFMTYPVQRYRLDIWKYFLQPSGIIPIFKNVNNTFLLIQMVSAQMGITTLPQWVVDNFERQGLIVTKRIGNGIWRRLYAAIRNGEQKELVIKNFIHSIRLHASMHLQFIRNIFK